MRQRPGPFPHGPLVDMAGWRFGKLTVLEKVDNAHDGHPIWLCRCDCGRTKRVRSGNLRNGGTTSCGCVYRASRKTANATHGLSKHPLYSIWRGMHSKCYKPHDPTYPAYGGRGIGVDPAWHDDDGLRRFIEDVGGEVPTNCALALIDMDKDFGPDNWQWARRGTIARRRRDLHRITWRGKTLSLCEWAEIVGINEKTLGYRVKHWGTEDLDRVFLTPLRGFRKEAGKSGQG